MKTCTKCGETKPLDDFFRDRSRADGRKARCHECEAEYKRRYREENRDKVREYRRRYYEENRDKSREHQRRYYEENRDKVREYQRRYYEENRDRERDRKRRYWEENRDKERESQRQYREENLDYHRALSRANISELRSLSAEMATVPPHARWTAEEDAVLMADNGMTVFQKAIHLGRTYNSCVYRRTYLRQVVAA